MNIKARVMDEAGNAYNKNFTVDISGPNHAPTDLMLKGGNIAENSQAGTVLGYITGIDADNSTGAFLRYSLIDNANGRFVVNSTTGEISVAQGAVLDYEATHSINVTARVTDQGGLYYDKVVMINLSNVNEAPTSLSLTKNIVVENSRAGTIIGYIKGVDADANSKLSYSLTDDAGGRFSVNASTGAVSVNTAAVLDYEKTPILNISARVTDEGGLSRDTAFSIVLTNVNEAPTAITISNSDIAENTKAGTVVGVLTGSDPDANSILSYTLTNNGGGRFVINSTTGEISVAQGAVLDYEATHSINVTARVTDQGGLYYDKVVTFNLSNVNEAPVNLTLSNTILDENSAAWTVVGTMKGVDYDSNFDLSYSLVNDADGRFVIDGKTGVVRVNTGALLDAKLTPALNITGRVADQGSLTYDKDFTIVLDAVLEGNAKRNAIVGLSSNNVITGGKGNDTLTGGAGSDTFVFHQGDGWDVITDFAAKGTDHDIIQLDPTMVADWTDLLSKSKQSAANVVILANAYDKITLNNVSLSSLTQENFKFVA